MSNFWADKLANRAPVQQPSATPAWWDGDGRPEPVQAPVDQSPRYAPQGAPSARSNDNCPECGSGNYMQPGRNAAFRCFDCNYPTMHSTSGQSVGSATPYGKPVRQVTGSGWHPDTIIGRIS